MRKCRFNNKFLKMCVTISNIFGFIGITSIIYENAFGNSNILNIIETISLIIIIIGFVCKKLQNDEDKKCISDERNAFIIQKACQWCTAIILIGSVLISFILMRYKPIISLVIIISCEVYLLILNTLKFIFSKIY